MLGIKLKVDIYVNCFIWIVGRISSQCSKSWYFCQPFPKMLGACGSILWQSQRNWVVWHPSSPEQRAERKHRNSLVKKNVDAERGGWGFGGFSPLVSSFSIKRNEIKRAFLSVICCRFVGVWFDAFLVCLVWCPYSVFCILF